MDKFLIRKDVYDELIEKGYGKKDLSKLTKKKITDKNGHTRTVYVRNGEQPAAQNQPKAQDELTPEKKARYEEMLEKVKAGPDENALFVSSKGMLNKKDAIAHLEAKLGKKPMNSAYQGHLESENPPNTDITKEDEERFGKQALSGLSGKRTGSEESKKTPKLGLQVGDIAYTKYYGERAEIVDVDGEWVTAKMNGRTERYKENAFEGKLEKPAKEETKEVDFKKWLEDNDIVPEEMAGESHAQIYKKVRKTGLDDDAAMKITNDIMAYNEAYKSEKPKEEKYDDNKAFEEYKKIAIKDDLSDEDYKRLGQLVNEHFKHSKDAWPGGAKLREESGMWEKRYNNLKEGDQITAYGKEMKVVKKNEYNKTIKAEFVTKDGRKHTTDLSIMDIDDSSFDKDGKAKKSAKESKSSVNGFTLDDIYHHGSDKQWSDVKKIDDMETAKGVVEMIAQKYGTTDKGREQLMDFIAYNIGGTNPLYDKLYEEYGVDADDLDMDFEASHDLILNQAMGKDTKKNREQIADSKADFETRYRQMLEREG